MKKLLFAALLMLSTAPMFADTEVNTTNDEADVKSEFGNEESVTYGIANDLLEKVTNNSGDEKPKFGAKLTDFASVPKIGGYFIEKYAFDSRDGQQTNEGFSQRLIRFYIDGTILKDFTYRFQLQTNNASFHMKDFFVEWGKFKEFKIKIGQYKRAFGFENPMNPWDVGVGDYSQLTKKLTGHSDYIGAESSSNGGRDQGLQFQGDLFPMGKDGHRLIHYQLMVSNGQGINTADLNTHKDITGTIQVQPIKGLFVGFFGWTGNYTNGTVTVDRKRYILGAKYDWHDWSFRTEYGHAKGYRIKDWDGTQWNGTGKADAFYATVGIPAQPWLKVYLKYDQYREQANSATAKTIYSVAPNFRLHKNLMFQLQYNYVHDNNLAEPNYSEIWVETYVRF